MAPREQQLIIVLADISGYTRFIVENEGSAVSGQLCVAFLIESVLREVDIPLQLQEIEGDAVFLYAAHPGDEVTWRQVLAQVRSKLVRVFDAFRAAMADRAETSSCPCAICRNANELRLKAIVHSGHAVFHSIAGRALVSGADVILAHRLLKNSVPSHEYLLMTESAYQELGREMDGVFQDREETYEGYAPVRTYVRDLSGQNRPVARSGKSHTRRSIMNAKNAVAVILLGLSLGFWVGFGHGGDRPGGTAGGDKAPVAAPEFTGVTEWLNTKPLKLADQKGKVVVVHFWTNGCINCIHNYPHYRAWQDKYKDEKNFLIVGIHTPEFDAEENVDRIKERMTKNRLTFAVAVDNDSANWKAWGNQYWPCVYLVDKTGNVRQRWEGELGAEGYKSMTDQIDKLLAE
jgi:thiol-disulfide isomerase/thioredoxin